MFDVSVTELTGKVCCFSVRAAIFVAAIGDDEGGFVLWEQFGEFLFSGDKINRTGDMAGAEGVGAIDIDEGDFSFVDCAFEFVEGDVGVFFCRDARDEREEDDGGEGLAAVHGRRCWLRGGVEGRKTGRMIRGFDIYWGEVTVSDPSQRELWCDSIHLRGVRTGLRRVRCTA